MFGSHTYRLELTLVDNNTGVIKTYQKEYFTAHELHLGLSRIKGFVNLFGLPFAPPNKSIYLEYVIDDKSHFSNMWLT